MNSRDFVPGDVKMTLVHKQGKVHMLFDRQTDFVICDPQNAVDIAEALTNLAFEADTGLKPVGPALKAQLVQKHREKLIPRIALMLNGQREKRTVSNGALALQIMDAVCSEVFS